MKTAFISLGSVTYAVKARRLLMHEGVTSKLVKQDGTKNSEGCIFGIEIKSGDIFAAAEILRSGGMKYTVYER